MMAGSRPHLAEEAFRGTAEQVDNLEAHRRGNRSVHDQQPCVDQSQSVARASIQPAQIELGVARGGSGSDTHPAELFARPSVLTQQSSVPASSHPQPWRYALLTEFCALLCPWTASCSAAVLASLTAND